MASKEQKIDLKKMRNSAEAACRLMKALNHRDRLMLLCEISQGEKCVGELEEILDIHQPMLSQHLTGLRTAKLVKTRREGKQIYYSLGSESALAVIEVLYQQFCQK
ncbi:metalloregulator ArsR/SmtB family transcription factor [Polynucleobacter sp. MWH-Braz-FAM2G]|uniref:ArsR/SmtB family transcription factor n=1 Tax=Polynucleobacter sp. MWH-Braz-FAM2G TaxID=1855883 RepID=UPI001BFD20AF|nr:metalloregulator ArsR/SmtB family transcription factor [Polynucleobacter sp. MWH-Braz-FAM2G]QWD91238.1 helix-turn-helix transcriptional regulator [Polynucleobacter sp. MWH-Braz-FAM2G]